MQKKGKSAWRKADLPEMRCDKTEVSQVLHLIIFRRNFNAKVSSESHHHIIYKFCAPWNGNIRK